MSGDFQPVTHEYWSQVSAGLDDPSMKKQAADKMETFVRDRLREESFARNVVPPMPVTRAECQVSETQDTLVKIEWIEPTSKAMVLAMRGEPKARYLRAPRAAVGFWTISSEKFQKTEQELMVYPFPLTKVVEDNSLKDMQELEDHEWIIHAESCVQALQTEANSATPTALAWSTLNAGTVAEFSIFKGELARNAGVDNAQIRALQKPDIRTMKQIMSSKRLVAECMLITQPDFEDVETWTLEDQGDKIQSETVVNGYKYNTLVGLRVIKTIKTDILRRGNVYVFAAPRFMGKFYILNNPKFWIDKKANLIEFQAWEDIGFIFLNVSAVGKLELFSANANPGAGSQTHTPTFTPKAQDDLGAVNNRLDSGVKFPSVVSF